jgi:ankyrin repeat protein
MKEPEATRVMRLLKGPPTGLANVRLLLSAAEGSWKDVEECIRKGADPNTAGKEGVSALFEALESANFKKHSATKAVSVLLKSKANPNVIEPRGGRSPLIEASMNKCEGPVKLLIKYRADLALKDLKGRTAVDWAKKMGNTDVETLLKRHWKLAQAERNKARFIGALNAVLFGERAE